MPQNFVFSVVFISLKNIIADGKQSFPLVMVGGVLEANKRWDIGKEVVKCIIKDYPGAVAIRPKVSIFYPVLVVLCETVTAYN